MKKGLFLLLLLIAGISTAQEIKTGSVENLAPQGSYTPSFDNDGADRAPKNIILMIGDGMGLSHISSAMYANGGELTIMNLKTCGFVRTSSATHFTTDSAASGTAYATGCKTHNSALGVDVDDRNIENIPEKLAPSGIVSGVVSSDYLDGATPAAFFAHQPKRYMSAEIWADAASSKLLFFAAGCKESFEKQSAETQEAINGTYRIVNSLDGVAADTPERVGYLPAKDEMTTEEHGYEDFLTQSTRFAIDYLAAHSTGDKGFFLMVEGAHIDKFSHGNDFKAVVREMLAFDKAVEEAVRFAEKDGNTLVIISADHETGALTLGEGKPAEGMMSGSFISNNHTASPVPLFAYGPSSRCFAGVQENSDVSNKITELLN